MGRDGRIPGGGMGAQGMKVPRPGRDVQWRALDNEARPEDSRLQKGESQVH